MLFSISTKKNQAFSEHFSLCSLRRRQSESPTGHEIATDMVANATNIFSLATKNSGLVATLATRFLYDLD